MNYICITTMTKKLNKKTRTADVFYEQAVHNGGMLYRRNPGWDTDGNNGREDALWRTSLGFITYRSPELMNGIYSCYQGTKKGYRINRWNYYNRSPQGAESCSRDQVIMSMVALRITYPEVEEVVKMGRNYAKGIPFKISKKSYQTPDMFLWVKYMAGSKLYAVLYCLLAIPTLSLSNCWNWVIRKVLGFKDISQDEWGNPVPGDICYYSEFYAWKREHFSFFQKLLHKTITPTFSYHLTAWMIYCLPKIFILKPALQWIIRQGVERDNLLIQMLMGKYISRANLIDYDPMIGTFRWQTRLDGSSSMYIKMPNKDELERIKYNTMDKDILFTMYDKIYGDS